VYFTANQGVYRRTEGSPEGLDVSFGWDRSAKDIAQQNSQVMVGIKYNGPIPRRRADALAFGFVSTKVGAGFSALNELEYGFGLGRENMYEVNYRAQLKPYIVLQPTLEYHANVGGTQPAAAG
jgi:carbohydrate-selective porin OprB